MSTQSNTVFYRTTASLLSAVAILFCLWLIWIGGRISLSSIFTKYAVAAGSIAAASEAVRVAPSDAEAHLALATLLRARGETVASVIEFEQAALLRPRDFDLWVQLGLARDENNDSNGALAAFNEAVRLAPYYAEPLWQRGNLLLRRGSYDEAFRDLRAAADSNPDFIPGLIDLSWGISRSDPKMAEQLLQPRSSETRLAFAQYLARQGRGDEAVTYFRSAGPVTDEVKRQFVSDLINKNSLAQAFEIWSGKERDTIGPASIYDGGFEGPLNIDESGFGWRVQPESNDTSLSLDVVQPHTGAKSLRIDFKGESNPETAIVSQLLLVKPSQTYRVSFAARTKEIVTGGLPFATIESAESKRVMLGHSNSLMQGTSDWQAIDFEFSTAPSTNAVLLSIKRQPCTTSPCPAFGTLWLDSFGIRSASQN